MKIETLEEHLSRETFPTGVDAIQTIKLAIWALNAFPVIEFYAKGRQEGMISGVEFSTVTRHDVFIGEKATQALGKFPLII